MINGKLIKVERTRKCRGRPNILLIEVIKNDISIKEVTESMTSNTLFHNMVIHYFTTWLSINVTQ